MKYLPQTGKLNEILLEFHLTKNCLKLSVLTCAFAFIFTSCKSTNAPDLSGIEARQLSSGEDRKLSGSDAHQLSSGEARKLSSAQVPQLIIDNPEDVSKIEDAGFSIYETLFGFPRKLNSNLELYRHAPYASIVDSIDHDLRALLEKDKLLGTSMNYGHRLFDVRWLKSSASRFELVGVINRMDRAVFNPGTCGELRLVYRLAYAQKQNGSLIQSRLPLTLNAVFALPKTSSCSEVAAKIKNMENLKEFAQKKNFKTLEVNLQATRWPSTVRPDMGGHAEYFLRVFRLVDGGNFALASLENTPDVEKLLASPQLKSELLAWLKQKENVNKLDAGVIVIPDKFLAKRNSSVALHGMNRLANRPFDQVFTEKDFADVGYEKLENIYGPSSYRRRLNDMSCAGCHQGRSIAGFHFVGSDSASQVQANSIFSSRSPHLVEDLKRRQVYNDKLLVGEKPNEARPFSERNPQVAGIYGDHCGLPNSEYASRWTCGTGLTCTQVVGPAGKVEIGECLPLSQKMPAGGPCEPGVTTQTANSEIDKYKQTGSLHCRESFHCEKTRVGFPTGMCSGGCDSLQPSEVCGAIAILAPFNACLAQGKPFSNCLSENVRPGSLQGCDESNACRSDYICTSTGEKRGACIPPYFLFQLRVDGHPKPAA